MCRNAALDIWPDGHSICKVPLRSLCSICAASRHVLDKTHCKQDSHKSMAFVLFHPIRMAGFGASALIFAPIWRDKKEGKNKEQGHSYRLPALRANIEFAFGKHIEFPVRETYRLKDWARTVTFFTFPLLRAFPPGGAAAHIEFPVRETYRLKDKARTGTPFYTSFITGAMARETTKAL